MGGTKPSLSLLEILKKMTLEKMLPEAQKVFGDMAAKQLLFKIVKDSAKDLALEGELEVSDVCDVVEGLASDLGVEAFCEEGEGSVKVSVNGCPVAIATGKSHDSGCIVLHAIFAGIMEAVTGQKVFVDTRTGKYGVASAPWILRTEECVLMGGKKCVMHAFKR